MSFDVISLLSRGLHALDSSIPLSDAFVRPANDQWPSAYYSPLSAIVGNMLAGFLIMIPLLIFFAQRPWSPDTSFDVRGGSRHPSLTWFDGIQRAVLLMCYVATIGYKYLSVGGLPFLLMPCHIITFVLCVLSLTLPLRPGSSSSAGAAAAPLSSRIAYGTFVLLWAPFLALALPEWDSLVLPFEKVHYAVYHTLMMTLPLTWLLSGLVPFYEGAAPHVTTWTLSAFTLSVPVQLVCTLTGGLNVAFMHVPPLTLEALMGKELAPVYYRPLFGFVAWPLLCAITHFSLRPLLTKVVGPLIVGCKSSASTRPVLKESSAAAAAAAGAGSYPTPRSVKATKASPASARSRGGVSASPASKTRKRSRSTN
jgi:hypothetical protein